MVCKYLYIDDTQEEIEQGTINGLQKGNRMQIDFRKPNKWEPLIEDLLKVLPQFNGLMLDLRLNDNAFEPHQHAKFRGSTLAQELRTLFKEHSIKDIPIVLISAEKNIATSLDITSLDLFDYTIKKGEIENKDGFSFTEIQDHLIWLSEGYDYLNGKERSNDSILNKADLEAVDFRFLDELSTLANKPVHVIARFLITKVLLKPSFLIDEDLLRVRLGITKDSKEWAKLREEHLKPFVYSGAFSSTYTRWYMQEISRWWDSKITSEKSLRSLNAKERVKLIMEKTGLTQLEAIPKIEGAKSEAFWVICKGRGIAIDTIDGFSIKGQDYNYPWQETEYVSINEALRPKNKDLWEDVATLEKPRLKKIKAVLEANEKRN